MAKQKISEYGVVIIGRNEGDRLRHCLASVVSLLHRGVYVDSGSIDGSVDLSQSRGALVVELDRGTPFTAARARNEGLVRLLSAHPELDYVFFVDGDCEVVAGWLDKAVDFLNEHPDVAVVCGRRRERDPEKSVYNMLCDIEWDTPIGETSACGGDALIRVAAFRQVHGFRPDLVCGEEPELCVRLRQKGWRIWRVADDMTIHDAAMYRFGQWWFRMLRGGYAFAQGADLHGAPPERLWVIQRRRAWIWGLWIPILALTSSVVLGWWASLLLAVYPIQIVRLALLGQRTPRENWFHGGALVLGKFPELLGVLKFNLNRRRHEPPQLIEYK